MTQEKKSSGEDKVKDFLGRAGQVLNEAVGVGKEAVSKGVSEAKEYKSARDRITELERLADELLVPAIGREIGELTLEEIIIESASKLRSNTFDDGRVELE